MGKRIVGSSSANSAGRIALRRFTTNLKCARDGDAMPRQPGRLQTVEKSVLHLRPWRVVRIDVCSVMRELRDQETLAMVSALKCSAVLASGLVGSRLHPSDFLVETEQPVRQGQILG